jgi:hypothetical protein
MNIFYPSGLISGLVIPSLTSAVGAMVSLQDACVKLTSAYITSVTISARGTYAPGLSLLKMASIMSVSLLKDGKPEG